MSTRDSIREWSVAPHLDCSRVRCCRGRRALALPAALAALSCVAGARATAVSSSQPVDAPADAPRVEPMSLKITSLSLEAAGEFESRRVRTDGPGWFGYDTRQRNRDARIEEIARIGIDGAASNADILSFGGEIGLGMGHERYHESFNDRGQSDHANDVIREFDLHADLFQGSAISGTVFGLSTHNRYARPFLPSLHESRTDYGTAWTFNDATFPMELRAEHHDTERDGARRDLDREHITEDLLNYVLTWNHRANHTAKFDVEHSDRDERYSGSAFGFDTRRTQLRLDDAWQFGGSNQHRLDSIVRYQNESGDVSRDLLEIGPRLTLNHTPEFSTHQQYQYASETLDGLKVATHRGDAGFVHQLFTNLTTTANVFASHEHVEHDTTTRELGGTVDWAYVRNNALGAFSADLGLTQEYQHTRGGGVRAALRESASFRDPLPVTLARPNVFVPSIVVSNATRTRVFLHGIDYTIAFMRHYVLLVRSPLGRIANNDTVSIDYLYTQDSDATLDSTRADLRIQQEFASGWTPYYAFESRWEDRERSIGTPQYDNDLHRHRVGLKRSGPNYSYGVEFESLHDDVDPFNAYRIYVQRTLLARATTTVDGTVEFSQYFFDNRDRVSFFYQGPERDARLLDASIDGRSQWGRNTSGFGRVRYRYQDDTALGITNGVDAEVGAELRFGEYALSASIEYDLLNIRESRESGVAVWIRIRRDWFGESRRK